MCQLIFFIFINKAIIVYVQTLEQNLFRSCIWIFIHVCDFTIFFLFRDSFSSRKSYCKNHMCINSNSTSEKILPQGVSPYCFLLACTDIYTQSFFIRNGPIRNTSDIIAIFKKSPVTLSNFKNSEIILLILRNRSLQAKKTFHIFPKFYEISGWGKK